MVMVWSASWTRSAVERLRPEFAHRLRPSKAQHLAILDEVVLRWVGESLAAGRVFPGDISADIPLTLGGRSASALPYMCDLILRQHQSERGLPVEETAGAVGLVGG